MKVINLIGTILLFVFSLTAFAQENQEKKIIQSNQEWIQYYNKTNFTDNWLLLFDTGYRRKDAFENPLKYHFRAGLAYQFNPHVSLLAGLAYNGIYTENTVGRYEIRGYQELVIKHKYNKIKTQHRIRVEQRNFRHKETNQKNFNHRFRYRMTVNFPLFSFSKKADTPQLRFTIGDEIFINTGKEIVSNMFAANRLIMGPSVKINEDLTLVFSYIYTFTSTRVPNEYRHIDIFLLALKHNLDLRKK